MIALLVLAAGLANPAVTQANIGSTICVAGWSASVRPPASYTDRVKAAQMKARGLTNAKLYELDHVEAISVGGHPTDPRNLRLQTLADARAKDRLEVLLHKLVCTGKVPLGTARLELRGDWRSAARRRGVGQ